MRRRGWEAGGAALLSAVLVAGCAGGADPHTTAASPARFVRRAALPVAARPAAPPAPAVAAGLPAVALPAVALPAVALPAVATGAPLTAAPGDEAAAAVAELGGTVPAAPRVLFVGDSIMGQVQAAAAAALAGRAAATDFQLATGALRLGEAWADRWSELLGRLRPDVVVVLVGVWDTNRSPVDPGRTWRVGDPGFSEWYRTVVGRWLDELTAAGARVVWIGPPVASDPALDHRLRLLDDVYRSLAAERPGVVHLDPAVALGERFAARADDGTRLRMLDGLHLCPEGAARVADALAALLAGGAGPAVASTTPPAWWGGAWRADPERFPGADCPV